MKTFNITILVPEDTELPTWTNNLADYIKSSAEYALESWINDEGWKVEDSVEEVQYETSMS
jgi:hypothetical protein